MDKVAECERAPMLVSDPLRRILLEHLRDLWIGLADAREFFSEAEFAEQLEKVGRVHAKVLGSKTGTIH